MELGNLQFISIPHVQRDSIVKVLILETSKYFCYAIISKYGKLGLYDGNLEFLTSYTVIMAREDIDRSDADRRRRNRWITDGMFLPDVQMTVISNSTGSVTIYDVSSLNHVTLWLILGFPFVVQCLSYSLDKPTLFMGFDNGQVLSIMFRKKNGQLFEKNQNDKIKIFYWQELRNDKEYIEIKQLGKVHSAAVKYMVYNNENNTLISCSRDSTNSLNVKQVKTSTNTDLYSFNNIHWGVNCFVISTKLSTVITGSEDGFIRIWNSVVVTKPVQTITAHQSGIVDLVLFEHLCYFISLSRDSVLKVWNLKEDKYTQTIRLKFDCFKIEWGIKCIFPGPKRKSITSNDHFESLDLGDEYIFRSDQKITIEKSSGDKTKFDKEVTNIWERSNILITCCNQICKIQLKYNDGVNRNLECAVLETPPLLNSVLIPADWKSMLLLQHEFISVPLLFRELNSQTMKASTTHLDHLKFILDKTNLIPEISKVDINYKISRLETQKANMKFFVEQEAPFLALDLHTINEIEISPYLVVPNKKKIINLVTKTKKMLSEATAKTILFSEQSSSTKSPRSSRSTVVDFE